MKSIFTKYAIVTLAMLTSISLTASAEVLFSDDFSGDALDPLWTAVGDSHTGIKDGTYQFTDANDKQGTEIYRNIQTPPSGSFETSLTATFASFMSPNTKTTFTWNLNGRDGSVSLMLNSFGKLEMRHNDYDGKNSGLATLKNINYTDGSKITITLKYNADTDTLTALYTIDGGEAVEIYNGNSVEGGKFEDFASLRSTAKLYKFDGAPADQAVMSIDKWSMTEVQ